MLPGHVLCDQQGAIVEADDGFGALFMTAADNLRGLDILSITAPADRKECGSAIAALQATGRPFDIVKRFIRQDGSVFWVRNSVSRMSVQQRDLIVGTCTPLAEQSPRSTPAGLLQSARVQAGMAQSRSSICDALVLSGPAWPALLQVYIAEAEGRAVNVDTLAADTRLSRDTVARWIAALVAADVLEVERRGSDPEAIKAYRLTADALERLEAILIQYAPSASVDRTAS